MSPAALGDHPWTRKPVCRADQVTVRADVERAVTRVDALAPVGQDEEAIALECHVRGLPRRHQVALQRRDVDRAQLHAKTRPEPGSVRSSQTSEASTRASSG